MTDDPHKLITLDRARGHFPQNPSYNTVLRWTNEGVRGVLLMSEYRGGTKMTSVAWIERFNRECNAEART